MIERLVLVRHGEPETFHPEGDAARRLTDAGKAALRESLPRALGLLPVGASVRVWVSPAIRAVQTAELVADALTADVAELEVHTSLYAQDDDTFVAELAAEGGSGTVVAVGHIPFMERMLYELTGASLPFGKGCVASVALPAGPTSRGHLEWFVQGS